MKKLNYDKLYFLYFNLFLFFAGVISVYEGYWIVLSFVFLTFFVFYYPYLFGFVSKFVGLSFFEYFLVVFVYVLIFVKTFNFGFGYAFSHDFLFRVLFNLFFSFVISILGFFILYVLTRERNILSRSNPEILVLFIFCFSIMIVTFYEVIFYLLDYIFRIHFFNYNLSSSLGFIAVHFLGSFLVCFFVYLYLVSDDKHKIIFYLKKILGIKKERVDTNESVLKIVGGGESDFVEFKETLRTNVHTKKLDKRMEHSVLKTIVAFLNSKGGSLLVGVSDLGEVVGLGLDNFKCDDKCKLQMVNMVKQQIGVDVSSYVKISSFFLFDDDRYILKIDVKPSKSPFFLLWEKQEEFYIRVGPSSVIIFGSKMISYMSSRFSK